MHAKYQIKILDHNSKIEHIFNTECWEKLKYECQSCSITSLSYWRQSAKLNCSKLTPHCRLTPHSQINEPQSQVPPRLTHVARHVSANQGETVFIPCVAQGHPAPTYSVFISTNHHPIFLPCHIFSQMTLQSNDYSTNPKFQPPFYFEGSSLLERPVSNISIPPLPANLSTNGSG
ncbi:hypothetical protein CDAR_594261 [Caerostris darwini]|uniref:Ig-like domain-containing protein n=1 Tax=Caerostris darwini TaxID=1538125 RepID=A0AAV4PBJ5_9ARAC|nr:hypothetical protein CDAR_594261 [Caerostris darwini]